MFTSGVGFYSLFGLVWWLVGSSALPGTAGTVAVVAGCAVTIGLLIAARQRAQEGGGAPFPADLRRRFYQINALQWALIPVIVFGCVRLEVPELIPPLIALVVGLHFLPLATVFDQAALRVPAALLSTAALAGGIVWLGDGSAESIQLVVGSASGLSLWGTGMWTVLAMGATKPESGTAATAE